ncbi:DoxX family protein [Nocardia carnea]|uniref:DoxX family protein n=1 Tax=Nocardia carnea TaxID=37328 RepID=UPI002453774A|nr:DoxX family protein [Nocardia carnea]
MQITYLVVTVSVIVANAGMAVADFARAKFVLANSAEVHVPRPWLPWLATAKLAGAIGLLAGMLGARPVGIAAAAALVVFFVGAVVFHIRARVYYNIVFPGAYLAGAVAALGLIAVQ